MAKNQTHRITIDLDRDYEAKQITEKVSLNGVLLHEKTSLFPEYLDSESAVRCLERWLAQKEWRHLTRGKDFAEIKRQNDKADKRLRVATLILIIITLVSTVTSTILRLYAPQ